MHKIFLVMGRTAVGKSTLASTIAEILSLTVVKSYTTRTPRLEEVEGRTDHIFVSNEEFDKLLPSAIAYTEIKGNRYCTTQEQLFESDIYVIDPLGLTYLREQKIPDLELVSIYINCGNTDVREQRFLSRRGATASDFASRNEAEDAQFSDFEMFGECDYDVDNSYDDETCLVKLLSIFQNELKLNSEDKECN